MKKNVISFCVVLGLMYVFSVVLLGIGSVIIWKTGVTAKSISMAVILSLNRFVLPVGSRFEPCFLSLDLSEILLRKKYIPCHPE